MVAGAVVPGSKGRSLPFSHVSRLLVTSSLVSLLLSLASVASASEPFPEYTGADFQALYEHAIANTLPNLESPNGRYTITGDDDLDERIWELASQRGYVLRPTAGEDLAAVDGVPMQPQAADAWRGLKDDARRAGMRFIVSSAYRSPVAQRAQFLSKLQGSSDAAIDATLTWYSVPGTSKHHAGYALDFRYSNGTFGNFRSTVDYAWLKADNFAVPKSHGFIPSYPDDVSDQGPNPEPWEFVWVGTHLIHCGLPQGLAVHVDGPAGALLDEIEHCPGGPTDPIVPDWLSG